MGKDKIPALPDMTVDELIDHFEKVFRRKERRHSLETWTNYNKAIQEIRRRLAYYDPVMSQCVGCEHAGEVRLTLEEVISYGGVANVDGTLLCANCAQDEGYI